MGPRPLHIPPRFHVVPAGHAVPGEGVSIVLGAGSGFGDGRHETTQLCLQAVGALAARALAPWRLLDFGSGTGILSIAAAKLGGTAVGVEIDPEAVASAHENAGLSGVTERVCFARSLDEPAAAGPFDLVVANILRAVLLDFAAQLTSRVAPGGALVLSGLVSTDVPEVSARYARHLGGRRPEVYSRGEWRGLVWRTARPAPAP